MADKTEKITPSVKMMIAQHKYHLQHLKERCPNLARNWITNQCRYDKIENLYKANSQVHQQHFTSHNLLVNDNKKENSQQEFQNTNTHTQKELIKKYAC